MLKFMKIIKFKLLIFFDQVPWFKKFVKVFLKILQFPTVFMLRQQYEVFDANLQITECDFDDNIFQGYFAKKIMFDRKTLYQKIVSGVCELYEYDLNLDEARLLVCSKYWSKQQGTMAEYTSDGKIVCNATIDDKQVVVVIDDSGNLENLEEGYIFQSVSGCDWICLVDSFPVNMFRPEYGFSYGRRNYVEPKNEALVFYNLTSGQRWAVKISEIKKLLDVDQYENFELNHFQFNQDSNDCIGLLRAYDKSGRCRSALFHFNPDSKLIFNILGFEVISHFTWLSGNKIVYWGTYNGANRSYWIVDITASRKKVRFLNDLPDGHPVRISENEFVTDTYPNKFGWITLYKCNLDGDIEQLMITSHPWELRTSNRCDAHPKYDPKHKKLFIDTRVGSHRTILCLSGLE
jgi:hypothetical protein